METHSNIFAWENLMDRGAWQATVRRVAEESHLTQQPNNDNSALNFLFLKLQCHSFLKKYYLFVFGCSGSLLLLRLSLVVSRGYFLVVVCGLLIAVASLVSEHRLQSTGSIVVAQELCFQTCGIFLDQGSNPSPLHWQADSQPLDHQGSRNSLTNSRIFLSVQYGFLCIHKYVSCYSQIKTVLLLPFQSRCCLFFLLDCIGFNTSTMLNRNGSGGLPCLLSNHIQQGGVQSLTE